MNFLEDLRRALRPLHNRVANMVGRGVVKGADDSKQVQELQISLLDGETRDEVERLQNYGFTSVPLEGAECVAVFVNGRRDQGFVVAADDRRHRPKDLQPGEVAVYDKNGSLFVTKANGDIEVTPKPGQTLKITGNVEVTGTLTASTDVVGGGKSLKNHTHSATLTVATTGGPTAQSGTATGNTGLPN